MRTFATVTAAVAAAVLVQFALPDRPVYHAGWYNVAIVAAIALALSRANHLMKASEARGRIAVAAAAFGCAAVGIAGVASGLLGPDTQTIVGAPGSSARVDAIGRTLDFPSLNDAHSVRTRVAGASLLLRPVLHPVVEIEAYDVRGGRLTITQPSGTAFLSPVLLMQSRQTIAGLNVPVDAFSVPAIHRSVRAVLFSAQEAAQLRAAQGQPGPAVLFDVEDEAGRSLPHGLVLARDGQTATAAGLRLRPQVAQFPEFEAIAIPNVFAVGLGIAAILIGAALLLRPTNRSARRDP